MSAIKMDVNKLSRDELLDLVRVQSEKLTNQLQGMIAREGRINQLEWALDGLMEVVELAGLHDYPEYKRAKIVLRTKK